MTVVTTVSNCDTGCSTPDTGYERLWHSVSDVNGYQWGANSFIIGIQSPVDETMILRWLSLDNPYRGFVSRETACVAPCEANDDNPRRYEAGIGLYIQVAAPYRVLTPHFCFTNPDGSQTTEIGFVFQDRATLVTDDGTFSELGLYHIQVVMVGPKGQISPQACHTISVEC